MAGVAMAAGHRPCSLEAAVACSSTCPRRIRCAPPKLPCRGGCRGPTPCPHRWTGVRETTGYCPRRQIVRGYRQGHRHQPGHVCRTPAVGERSLERPFRKQRTVNPGPWPFLVDHPVMTYGYVRRVGCDRAGSVVLYRQLGWCWLRRFWACLVSFDDQEVLHLHRPGQAIRGIDLHGVVAHSARNPTCLSAVASNPDSRGDT
jgi:hypothetical protein